MAQPSSATPSAAQAAVVRVGNVGTLAEAGQVIALARGYFHDEGIEIAYTTFDSAARMVSPLGTGQLDIGSGAVSAGLFNAVARGVALRIAGPQARHDPGASSVYLVVSKLLFERREIATYADLRGHKVAVNATGIWADYALGSGLSKLGIELSDLELVEMSFPDMITALATGAVSVAVAAEPTATQAQEQGVAYKWHEIADLAPGVQATVITYAPDFSRTRADVGQRWMTAYLRGVRDYHAAFIGGSSDRDALSALLAEATAVKKPELYRKMGFAYIDPNGEVSLSSLADQLAWFSARGLLSSQPGAPLELSQMVDATFAEHAVARLGRAA